MSELTTELTSGRSTRLRHLAERDRSRLADPELTEHERELVDDRALHVLAELAERRVEPEPCLDAHGNDVECVRQLSLISARRLLRPRVRD